VEDRLHDAQPRLAAVDYLKRASAGGVLTSDDLKRGFVFEGARVPLINPQRGIFKPAAMNYLLSVRTVYPASGRKVWYDDQRQVHGQIERGDHLIDYAFMGNDPESADNRWLREARDAAVPILYFLGVAPQRYTLIWPTYVVDWSATELKARLAFLAHQSAQRRRGRRRRSQNGATLSALSASDYIRQHSGRLCLLRMMAGVPSLGYQRHVC